MTSFLHIAGLTAAALVATCAAAAVILGVIAYIRVGPEFPRND